MVATEATRVRRPALPSPALPRAPGFSCPVSGADGKLWRQQARSSNRPNTSLKAGTSPALELQMDRRTRAEEGQPRGRPAQAVRQAKRHCPGRKETWRLGFPRKSVGSVGDQGSKGCELQEGEVGMTERPRIGILNGPKVKWGCYSQPISVPGRKRAHTWGLPVGETSGQMRQLDQGQGSLWTKPEVPAGFLFLFLKK